MKVGPNVTALDPFGFTDDEYNEARVLDLELEIVQMKNEFRDEVRSCLEYLAYQGEHGAGQMAGVAQAILDKWRDENLEPKT